MSKEKEENLFDINIDDVSSEKEIDSSFFEQEEPETNEDDNSEPDASTDANEGKPEGKKPDEEEEEGFDPSQIENTENTQGTETDTSINNPKSNSSSLLQTFVDTLKDDGVIDIEEGSTIESTKDLIDIVRDTISKKELEDLNEDQALYVKSLRNGIPEEEIKTNFNNTKALSNISEEAITKDESLRKILITQDYIAKGLSEAKAAKLAERSVEVGEDLEDSKEALASLKVIESNRLVDANKKIESDKKAADKTNEERLSTLKDNILKKDDWVKGIKVNSTTKQKIFDNMTKVVDYTKDGKGINAINKARLADPDQFEQMESFIYTITNGFTDFSKFTKSATTSALNKLDKALESTNTGGGTSPGIKSTSQKGLMDALGKFGN